MSPIDMRSKHIKKIEKVYLDQRAYLNRMLRLETEPALANATFCALPA